MSLRISSLDPRFRVAEAFPPPLSSALELEAGYPNQVVGGHREEELSADSHRSSEPCLARPSHRFGPAEDASASPPDRVQEALRLRHRRHTGPQIALRAGLSTATVARIPARHGLSRLKSPSPRSRIGVTSEIARANWSTSISRSWAASAVSVTASPGIDAKTLGAWAGSSSTSPSTTPLALAYAEVLPLRLHGLLAVLVEERHLRRKTRHLRCRIVGWVQLLFPASGEAFGFTLKTVRAALSISRRFALFSLLEQSRRGTAHRFIRI